MCLFRFFLGTCGYVENTGVEPAVRDEWREIIQELDQPWETRNARPYISHDARYPRRPSLATTALADRSGLRQVLISLSFYLHVLTPESWGILSKWTHPGPSL